MDVRNKRGSFIGRIHSILQEMHFASPLVKMKMINIYASSFYGSPLWNIFDGSCDKLYTAWNNAIRDAFAVHRQTHRYLVEEISESEHPQLRLSLRFLKFHKTLQKSGKISIRFLSTLSQDDMQTSYSQNLKNIADRTKVNIDDLEHKFVKENFKYCEVPDDQVWRVAIIKDLLEVRWNTMEIDVMDENFELEKIIEFLCSS